MIELSILELGADDVSYPDLNYIENTIEYCQLAEQLNFKRFWLGEHHELGCAWRSPEIFMSVLAGYTDKIKIGSAGILLPANSTLRVAQNFKFLSTIFNDRIDLGIAKALPPDEVCYELVHNHKTRLQNYNHDEEVLKLRNFLSNQTVKGYNNNEVYMQPLTSSVPEIWVLSSTARNFELVLDQKFSYSLSLFHQVQTTEGLEMKQKALKTMKEDFISKHNIDVSMNICLSLICDDNVNVQKEISKKFEGRSRYVNFTGSAKDVVKYIKDMSNFFEVNEVVINLVSDNPQQKNNAIKAIASGLN